MGREAKTIARWAGKTGEVVAHLDSQHLQLRGDISADFSRDDLRDIVVVADGLQVHVGKAPLLLGFSPTDATRWQKALLKEPPTLAEKLGISGAAPAFVLGAWDDAQLARALHNAQTQDATSAAVIVAVVVDAQGLDAAEALAASAPEKHIWMIYNKGKAAIGDAAVRSYLRSRGYRDNKTCAVSDTLTATRYRKPTSP